MLARNPATDQDVADLQDDDGPRSCKRPRYENTPQLIKQLAAIAIHKPERFVAAVDQVGGENARKQRAYCAARAVDSESIERIIVVEFAFYGRDHEIAKEARRESDKHRREGFHEPGSWRDGNQSSDGSGDTAENARFSVRKPFGEHPAKRRGRRSEVCRDEGAGGET